MTLLWKIVFPKFWKSQIRSLKWWCSIFLNLFHTRKVFFVHSRAKVLFNLFRDKNVYKMPVASINFSLSRRNIFSVYSDRCLIKLLKDNLVGSYFILKRKLHFSSPICTSFFEMINSLFNLLHSFIQGIVFFLHTGFNVKTLYFKKISQLIVSWKIKT